MLELITGPMTGQQYLDSLQDGREVYIYGERVKDVVTHRAFRNAARSIARLYDALHDPKHKDALLATDRQGILTHKFFKPSYSAQELLEAREAIATWARFSYGFMGRTPDYTASMLATGSALTHATFVAQNSATQLEQGKAEDYALVFLAPLNTQGQKLICRASYEAAAHSPFDQPLSSRFDENDAVLVFDNAFIPWENVLVYRDIEKATGFYAASGFLNRYNFQSLTRLAVKLDFMCGLLTKGVAATGTEVYRGVQSSVGEV